MVARKPSRPKTSRAGRLGAAGRNNDVGEKTGSAAERLRARRRSTKAAGPEPAQNLPEAPIANAEPAAAGGDSSPPQSQVPSRRGKAARPTRPDAPPLIENPQEAPGSEAKLVDLPSPAAAKPQRKPAQKAARPALEPSPAAGRSSPRARRSPEPHLAPRAATPALTSPTTPATATAAISPELGLAWRRRSAPSWLASRIGCLRPAAPARNKWLRPAAFLSSFGSRRRARSASDRDAAVTGDLGGHPADPADVGLPVLLGEAQAGGEVAAYDVAVEAGHGAPALLEERSISARARVDLPLPERPVKKRTRPCSSGSGGRASTMASMWRGRPSSRSPRPSRQRVDRVAAGVGRRRPATPSSWSASASPWDGEGHGDDHGVVEQGGRGERGPDQRDRGEVGGAGADQGQQQDRAAAARAPPAGRRSGRR